MSKRRCWWIFFHDWEFLGEWGLIHQQKKCRKCGRLKIILQ